MGLTRKSRRAARAAAFALASFLLAACALAVPNVAQAQIWVVTEADGSERFTTEPEPGARVFVRTRYTAPHRAGLQIPFGDSIRDAAADNGVEPALVTAVIAAESNFDPDALSAKGAQGLMQLMPATASDLGVRNVWDPDQNIRGGTAYLARLLGKYDNVTLALAAYNAGEGTVDRHGGVPPFQETQNYVSRVLGYYKTYTQSNS